ncbi:MAG: outer membrane beta-barrel protein [Chitinophagaceae bacterium]|nr:outer membrane beta-barrel protein [Chitinophagaceae bacterium]
MPANEFEKQVQKQMEEFRLEPSASVWENVEKEIREKKRRRIIFFFLLPLAAGLIVFSLYQFVYLDKKTEAIPPRVAVKEKLLPDEKKNTVSGNDNKTTVLETTSATKEIISSQSQTATIKRTTAKGSADDIISGKKLSTIPVSQTSQNNIVAAKKVKRTKGNSFAVTVDAPSKQEITKDAIASSAIETEDGKKEVVADIMADIPPTDKKETALKAVKTDTTVVKKDSMAVRDVIAEADKKETILSQKRTPSKLKWGIDLSAGFAYNNKSTLTFARAEAFDRNYATPGNVTGTPTGPVVINEPSPVRQGPAFRLGIVAEKTLSKRNRLSAGLQYAYSSNRIRVGSVTDTTLVLQSNANSFSSDVQIEKLYQGAQNNNYTNRYHFVRLPLTYHWQFIKVKKLPVELNAGVGISYLFTTNALVYSGSLGGIYYEDKKAFNKLHWDFSTGLSFRLKAKNNTEWVIGPGLSFDMSRLVKNDNKQYLMFGGISARWLFSKKKN